MGTKMKKKKAPASDTLDKRYMIRCASKEWAIWDAMAAKRGFNGAGPLIRKTMTDMIEALPKPERAAFEAKAAEILKAAA